MYENEETFNLYGLEHNVHTKQAYFYFPKKPACTKLPQRAHMFQDAKALVLNVI